MPTFTLTHKGLGKLRTHSHRLTQGGKGHPVKTEGTPGLA